MQVKLLLFTVIWMADCMQFLSENCLNGCQVTRCLISQRICMWTWELQETSRKGPFIATQLNSTRRRVELCRYKRALRCLQVFDFTAEATASTIRATEARQHDQQAKWQHNEQIIYNIIVHLKLLYIVVYCNPEIPWNSVSHY